MHFPLNTITLLYEIQLPDKISNTYVNSNTRLHLSRVKPISKRESRYSHKQPAGYWKVSFAVRRSLLKTKANGRGCNGDRQFFQHFLLGCIVG